MNESKWIKQNISFGIFILSEKQLLEQKCESIYISF